MLSADIHKDLTRYRAKIFGGLTVRTASCIAAGIGSAVAIALYSTLVLGLQFEQVSWAVYLSAILIWPIGFVRPDDMDLEEWLPFWWRHHFGTTKLKYETRARFDAGLSWPDEPEEVIRPVDPEYAHLRAHQRALEAWRPGEDLDDE